jgi:hypothetical protein
MFLYQYYTYAKNRLYKPLNKHNDDLYVELNKIGSRAVYAGIFAIYALMPTSSQHKYMRLGGFGGEERGIIKKFLLKYIFRIFR